MSMNNTHITDKQLGAYLDSAFSLKWKIAVGTAYAKAHGIEIPEELRMPDEFSHGKTQKLYAFLRDKITDSEEVTTSIAALDIGTDKEIERLYAGSYSIPTRFTRYADGVDVPFSKILAGKVEGLGLDLSKALLEDVSDVTALAAKLVNQTPTNAVDLNQLIYELNTGVRTLRDAHGETSARQLIAELKSTMPESVEGRERILHDLERIVNPALPTFAQMKAAQASAVFTREVDEEVRQVIATTGKTENPLVKAALRFLDEGYDDNRANDEAATLALLKAAGISADGRYHGTPSPEHKDRFIITADTFIRVAGDIAKGVDIKQSVDSNLYLTADTSAIDDVYNGIPNSRAHVDEAKDAAKAVLSTL
ncbi:MAG: hypothetical protein MRY32_09000 [Rickettsiales bacterium]|nr:hypothetical protein [Rickettsiales bacterium]